MVGSSIKSSLARYNNRRKKHIGLLLPSKHSYEYDKGYRQGYKTGYGRGLVSADFKQFIEMVKQGYDMPKVQEKAD